MQVLHFECFESCTELSANSRHQALVTAGLWTRVCVCVCFTRFILSGFPQVY